MYRHQERCVAAPLLTIFNLFYYLQSKQISWKFFKVAKYQSLFNFSCDQCILVKRALSQKSLYPGLFTNWPGILWTGFISEISWPEMKSTAAMMIGKLNRLCYFKRVTIFRDDDYPNIGFHDALRIRYLKYILKTICFLSIWICASNFVQVRP